MDPETQTDYVTPASTTVNIGSLSVVADGPGGRHAKVMIDGKCIPAKRLVIDIDVHSVITARLEWYPGYEFAKDKDGGTWLKPIAAKPAEPTPEPPKRGREFI